MSTFGLPYVDFSLQVHYANKLGKLDDHIVTPLNTIISVEIRKFPFKGNDTLLAVETMIVSAKANAGEVAGVVVENQYKMDSDDGLYFEWDNQVTGHVNMHSSDVTAKTKADIKGLGS